MIYTDQRPVHLLLLYPGAEFAKRISIFICVFQHTFWMAKGLHLYSTFNQGALQYCLTITHSPIHPHTNSGVKHTATASSSSTVRFRCLAQGHLDTQTSTLAVTSQPLYLLSYCFCEKTIIRDLTSHQIAQPHNKPISCENGHGDISADNIFPST